MVNKGFGQQYSRKEEYGVYVKFLCNLQPNTPGYSILTHDLNLLDVMENYWENQ